MKWNVTALMFAKRYILLCILLFTLFLVITPEKGHDYDSFLWQKWAEYIFLNGLENVYSSSTDYLPLFHYVLKAYGDLQGNIENIAANISSLKLFTLLFHFITALFLALVIKRHQQRWEGVLEALLFYLLNIAILYNTLIWGQVDAILTSLVFISFYFSYQRRVLPALVFLLLAINFKLQAIIFIPLLGLLILPEIIATFSIKNIAKWMAYPLLIQVMIISPFIYSGTLENMWGVVTASFGKYPAVSMNAYNVWDLLLSGDLLSTPDTILFLGLSYNHWGLLMFFATSGLALFPIAKRAYIAISEHTALKVPVDKVLLTFALIPLLFFYFNTQMHERYSHPALVFLVGYALISKKPWPAILGSMAYFLNMEGVLQFTNRFSYGTLIFDRNFISMLYLSTLVLLYVELYNVKLKKRVIPSS